MRWERPIYALAYRVIGREEEARDVAQETFLRAFRALGGFKGQAKFSSWLYRITLNLCRDWIRRERRTPVSQAPEGIDIIELAGETEPSESIEDLVSRRELGRAVAKAMAMLPEEQRTAIILKEYHGLTFQEIADMLECPLSTVKTRLYQGLTVLRKQLQRARRRARVRAQHRAAAAGGQWLGGRRRAATRIDGVSVSFEDAMCDKELLVGYLYDDMAAGRTPGHGRAPGHLRGLPGRAERPARHPHDAERVGAADPGPGLPVRASGAGARCRARARWTVSPAWGLAAAAVLVLSVATAIANVEVKYGADGFSVRTGAARGRRGATAVAGQSDPDGQRRGRRCSSSGASSPTIGQRLRALETAREPQRS